MATEPLRKNKPTPVSEIVIGVDLMGSDCSPPIMLDALASLNSPVQLLAIGTPEYEKRSPIPFHPAADFIAMDENPLTALRRKKESSLCVGLRLLKEGKIHALVSAGNTGAIVTGAKMILSMLPNILRPALLAMLPTKKQPVAVLDVGANVRVNTSHLIQFALMGAAYLQTRNLEKPRIGILNIGSEAMKGTSELRLAYEALRNLQNPPFHFAGNVESTSVFDGEVDVLITDGFTGNVFLKTAEGIANLFLDRINTELSDILSELMPRAEKNPRKQASSKEDRERSIWQSRDSSKPGGAQDRWRELQRHLHYAEYPGALLVGVRGLVIKCHGYSPPKAFVNGVRSAIELVEARFMQVFQNKLDKFHSFN